MLAAWRAEIEAEPIPELVDLDTAVAAVVAGMKARRTGARRRRAGRLRHLAPLAAAAAIIVATVSGVGLGSQNAMPGDTLWAIQKVVNPERAESVETKVEVESRLQKVRAALATGDTVTAARELEAIRTEIPAVRGEEGQPQLAPGAGVPGREAGRDAARRARGPDHAAEEQPDRPLDDAPGRAATAGVRAPPIRRSRSVGAGRPVGVAAGRRPDPRTPSEALGPGARVGVGFGGADDSRLGLVRAGGHEGAQPEPAPGEHGGRRGRDHRARAVRCDQPASEGGASRPASGGAQGGRHHARTTTASGSAGTSIDATGTATAS